MTDPVLQIVPLLSLNPELIALHLVRDALEPELLDELPDLARLVLVDPHVEGDRLAHGSLRGFLDLAVGERLQ